MLCRTRLAYIRPPTVREVGVLWSYCIEFFDSKPNYKKTSPESSLPSDKEVQIYSKRIIPKFQMEREWGTRR